jgi:hypothetical protein
MESSSPEFYLFLLDSLRASSANFTQITGNRNEPLEKLDFHNPTIPSHRVGLVKVMDALASFCLYGAKEQVISVSSSITGTGCKLCAQNGPVPDTVESQLRKIWSRLQNIGKALGSADDNPEKKSPDLSADPVAFEHEGQLREDIYTFSFEKIRRRILKRSDDWQEVLRHMREYQDPHDATLFPRLARELTLLFGFTRDARDGRTPIGTVSMCAQVVHVAFSPLLSDESPSSALGTFARGHFPVSP